MASTREGEVVKIYPTSQNTRYGQLIQGLDQDNKAKFFSLNSSGYGNVVIAPLRNMGTITVSGGTGSVALTNVNIASTFMGVAGPNKTNETFEVTFVDTDSGVTINQFEARSSNGGNATSKSLGVPLFNITITITEAIVDGEYTYLLMG